ncbi:vitamin B12 dependent-methionine synthase activation domain-containing protein [Reyranella sp.]|uniref:vitamin B12 dependent-methionine synthase activation domain-containing protein n=1 Tax=Reyranella sp. TaxID=1929291 RepID=UPI004036CC01
MDSYGYAAPEEALSNEVLMREKYRGIRAAPGYPPAPTTARSPNCSGCRTPARTPAFSGYYFAHPDGRNFGVARIRSRTIPGAAASRSSRRSAGCV